MEESPGFLYGTHARDKDATIAACLAAEIAASVKPGTLMDQLFALYDRFGIYREGISVLTSKEGQGHLIKVLDGLRKSPPKTLGGLPVAKVVDYNVAGTGLPLANVLSYTLQDQSQFLLRPSGTEPTVKIYGHIFSPKGSISELDKELQDRLQQIQEELF